MIVCGSQTNVDTRKEERKKKLSQRIELRFIISININKLWKYARRNSTQPKLMPSMFDVKSAQAVWHFRDMHF